MNTSIWPIDVILTAITNLGEGRLEKMAMMWYSTLLKSSEPKSHHQMKFSIIIRTLAVGFYPL